jgi:hypothetical protein
VTRRHKYWTDANGTAWYSDTNVLAILENSLSLFLCALALQRCRWPTPPFPKQYVIFWRDRRQAGTKKISQMQLLRTFHPCRPSKTPTYPTNTCTCNKQKTSTSTQTNANKNDRNLVRFRSMQGCPTSALTRAPAVGSRTRNIDEDTQLWVVHALETLTRAPARGSRARNIDGGTSYEFTH